mmetsp:Transcript_38567/g.44945  ORF Transcript_38567/g.44945 Transcript_38567/m.44945 type:complete len:194 (-) Transcript_38567:470-1051(-)
MAHTVRDTSPIPFYNPKLTRLNSSKSSQKKRRGVAVNLHALFTLEKDDTPSASYPVRDYFIERREELIKWRQMSEDDVEMEEKQRELIVSQVQKCVVMTNEDLLAALFLQRTGIQPELIDIRCGKKASSSVARVTFESPRLAHKAFDKLRSQGTDITGIGFQERIMLMCGRGQFLWIKRHDDESKIRVRSKIY